MGPFCRVLAATFSAVQEAEDRRARAGSTCTALPVEQRVGIPGPQPARIELTQSARLPSVYVSVSTSVFTLQRTLCTVLSTDSAVGSRELQLISSQRWASWREESCIR